VNSAGTEKVLHNFLKASDGESPHAGLIADSAGNLYGTTATGAGTSGNGIVFQLKP